ncbi:MAG TPA: beta galactosidase jelly roll domain-containing protein, partial [Armatimonadota bacterium]|nr:beta galactosidase jelly roll domain-containing protein [Armatimonadota bacterium]
AVTRRVEMASLELNATTLYVDAARAHAAWLAGPTADTLDAATQRIGACREFLASIADQDIVAEPILLGRLSDMANSLQNPPPTGATPAAGAAPETVEEKTFGHLWDDYEDLGSLPNEGWAFRTDPNDIGERNGWHEPRYNDSRWRLVEIGNWWEPQRGDYDGTAWYRRSIELPDAVEGRDAYLWFGAVDESAWVYLDGALIGEHDVGEDGWDKRFRIQLPPSVKPGRHVLVVKVLDRTLKGGIWKPIKIACPVETDEQ